MKRLLVFSLLVSAALAVSPLQSVAGSVPPLAGAIQSPRPPVKDHPVGTDPGTPDNREGGETVFDPLPIETLPFLDTGNTCDNLDDSDETCPYGPSTSPDVVYVYIPQFDQLLDIDLCGSGFDTKVYVYAGAYTPGDPYACNDDYYPPGHPCGDWVSRIPSLPVQAGVPYLIVVDGWQGDCGNYDLRVDLGQPPQEIISFAQLSFAFDGFAPTQYSSVGRMQLDTQVGEQIGYLNMAAFIPDVSVNSSWIVRNMLIPETGMGPPLEMLGSRFPMEEMGVTNGTPVSGIAYGYTITPEPLNDDDLLIWFNNLAFQGPVPVSQVQVDGGEYEAPSQASDIDIGLARWYLPYSPPLNVSVNSWIGCDMPNVQLDSTQTPLDWNGCAPAACANSLQWLKDKHPQIDFPPNLRQIFEQLSNLMNRLARQGAGPEQILTAKLDFIEAYGLPIHVKYQSKSLEGNQSSTTGESSATDSDGAATQFPTRAWIESESAAGEDVELGVGFYYFYDGSLHRDGGHAVAVTGTATINGVPKIWYKHDTSQKDGTGQSQDHSDIDVLGGGIIHLPGLDGWIKPTPTAAPVRAYAIVEAAFSESYDENVGMVPGTHTFTAYCQWYKRTIPPGKKFKITYPDDETRCFNSTIWRLDRTVQPPKWVKVNVWNFNSGQMREWVNTSDYPVTVAVHNDDHRTSGGSYVPYTVTLQILTAGGSDTTSPSNQDAYGGFSLGGSGDGSIEFGNVSGPATTVESSLGVDLSTVPGRLGASGITELTLTHDIPIWNPFWSELGLEIQVADLASPGQLEIDCPSTGLFTTTDVLDIGDQICFLGSMAPAGSFEVTLRATGGLDLGFDSIGVPSLVPIVTGVGEADVPQVLTLESNTPNPFNPATTIRFALPRTAEVSLGVFDVRGQLVATLANGQLEAGRHEVVWLGRDTTGQPVATGLYVYRLKAGGEVLTGKMMLVK